MPNRELSLIQIRTGKQRNVPNALELGEMAMTTDEGRVFIGLPSTIIPVSPVAGRTAYSVENSTGENVEVLTEFSPAAVVNRALSKAVKTTIPLGQKAQISIQNASRLDLCGFAYTNAALVTGTSITDKTINFKINYSYINSINLSSTEYLDSVGISDFANSAIMKLLSITNANGITTFVLVNLSGLPLTVEFTYRAWHDSLETISATLSTYPVKGK